MKRSFFDLARQLARLSAVVTLAATVVGTLLPAPVLPQDLPPDLLLHLAGYGVPALLAAFGARSTRESAGNTAIMIGFAVVSELAQALVPGRAVSALDLAANVLGIGIGTPLGWLIQLGLFRRISAAPSGQS